jgi:hypothetical protein
MLCTRIHLTAQKSGGKPTFPTPRFSQAPLCFSVEAFAAESHLNANQFEVGKGLVDHTPFECAPAY